MSAKRFLNLDFLKEPINKTIFRVDAKEVGLPPGSLIHVGEKKTEKPVISLVDYGPDFLEASTDLTVEEAKAC